MYFVSSSIYHKATNLALSEGMPSSSLNAHHSSVELQQNAKYIPIDLLFDVYELGDQRAGASFSVKQGKQLVCDDYGTLGLSWKTCWLAKEVIDRLERFMVLVTDYGSLQIEEVNGITKINLFRDASRRGVEISNEVSFVMIVNVLQEVTGKDITPVRVDFKHSCSDISQFQDFFRCPVNFAQPIYSLQFKTNDLNVQTIKADKSINAYLEERMAEEKRGIHSNADQLLKEVHQLIAESLPSGIPSIIQVSEYLGMSARTLKRRLSDKGHTFRDYVQNIQQEVATSLIRNSSQSMAEIAFQTGFSEQSAFNRAFKRWTGQSPLDYQKQQRS